MMIIIGLLHNNLCMTEKQLLMYDSIALLQTMVHCVAQKVHIYERKHNYDF